MTPQEMSSATRLSIQCSLQAEGGDEKLSEPVQCALEGRGLNVKVEIGVLCGAGGLGVGGGMRDDIFKKNMKFFI